MSPEPDSRPLDLQEINKPEHKVLLETLDDAVCIVQLVQNQLVYVNRAYLDLHGYTRESEMLGHSILEFVAPEDRPTLEAGRSLRLQGSRADNLYDTNALAKRGECIPVQLRSVPVLYNNETAALIFFRNLTLQRRMEAQLSYQAWHDPLTDLLNRRGFWYEMERQLASGQGGALLLLDIDQFKDINDSLGHPVGDEILVGLADFLRAQFDEPAAIARLGGDEFAISLSNTGFAEAETVGRRIVENLSHRVFETSSEVKVSLSTSVGVVLFPDHGETVDILLSHVDRALYDAKELGRNRFHVYTNIGEIEAASEARIQQRRALSQALEDNTLLLFAYPVLDLMEGLVSQYRVAPRLSLNNGQELHEEELGQLAERSGLSLDVDRFVADQTMRLLAREPSASPYSLTVGLSARSLDDLSFQESLTERLRAQPETARHLIFEITAPPNFDWVERARPLILGLRELGCRFTLDHFCDGFTSLDHLKHLRLDFLKFDANLVQDIAVNEQDQKLAGAVVAMANAIGGLCIASHVEHEASLAVLRDLGVALAAGEAVGRALPLTDLPGNGARAGQAAA